MREKMVEALHKAASEFINRESNRRSMITVTKVSLDRRGKSAEIFVSVFPEKDTAAATDFLNRQRREFSDYLKKHLRVHSLPHVEFLADPVIGGTIEEVQRNKDQESAGSGTRTHTAD